MSGYRAIEILGLKRLPKFPEYLFVAFLNCRVPRLIPLVSSDPLSRAISFESWRAAELMNVKAKGGSQDFMCKMKHENTLWFCFDFDYMTS